jgi:ABC-type antimicrobial peptide transport system permease subunit
VGAGDPVPYAAAALVLVVAAGLSALIPAWRAIRLDPVAVLRGE